MVLIIEPFGHAEYENIKLLEKRFDIKLPVDYKEFLVTQTEEGIHLIHLKIQLRLIKLMKY